MCYENVLYFLLNSLCTIACEDDNVLYNSMHNAKQGTRGLLPTDKKLQIVLEKVIVLNCQIAPIKCSETVY